MSGDCHRRRAEAHTARQRPGVGHSIASRDRRGPGQERHLGTTKGRGPVNQSKEHPLSHKGAKGHEESSASISRRSRQAFSKEESPRPLSREDAKGKSSSCGVKKDREGRGFQKFSPPSEVASVNSLKKRKRNHSEKTQLDKDKQPRLDSLGSGKRAARPLPDVKDKVADNLKLQEGNVKTSHWDKKSAGSLPNMEETDVEEEFEPPTMSFEAYLTYDQPPRKKKKKSMKTSTTVLEGKGLKKKDSKSASENLDLFRQLPKVTANESEKPQPPGADGAELKKVPADASPAWPDLPLRRVLPNYRPLPALEWMSSQAKERAPSSLREEEEAEFTGNRTNSKMRVFSGSKKTYLRKMMTLRQQCIQVLRNNLNSLFRVGGVPYSVIEPILESYTPDQLHSLEKCNHVLVKETDRLWKMHCHRNFKKEKPEEHESWKEMYLRLQDAQEQRLRALTLKIRSAHANGPTGRQTKMILFDSFERGASALQEKVTIKPSPYATASSHAPSSSDNGHSFHPTLEKQAYDRPRTTSANLVQMVRSSRKPTRQIAPMMAKTIKDFKNRFSQR